MITISVVTANLVADLLYSRLDPRSTARGGSTESWSRRRLTSPIRSPRSPLHWNGESPQRRGASRPPSRRLGSDPLRFLRRNKIGAAAFVVFGFFVFLAIFGPLLTSAETVTDLTSSTASPHATTSSAPITPATTSSLRSSAAPVACWSLARWRRRCRPFSR